ncbi:11517_t:CDS:2, partial [Paraglomus brasilianum]
MGLEVNPAVWKKLQDWHQSPECREYIDTTRSQIRLEAISAKHAESLAVRQAGTALKQKANVYIPADDDELSDVDLSNKELTQPKKPQREISTDAIVTNWVQEQGRSMDTVASMENPVTHAHEGLMLVNINMVNDSTPFSEPGGGAQDQEAKYKVDVNALQEPDVSKFSSTQLMTSKNWKKVMGKVECYRQMLAKKHCLHDPLYYYIVDHSGQHGPTMSLLHKYLPAMRGSLAKEARFTLPTMSDGQAHLFNQLFVAKHPDDISVKTDEERRIRDLVTSIVKAISMPGKDNIGKMEHTMRNVVPFLDATIGCDEECRVHYGEQTLEPTAVQHDIGCNPINRAQCGYKVDIIVEYQQLNWLPVVACGEVSGGLPQCSHCKEWLDTLKLGLELRDVWIMAQTELVIADAYNLVVWGFTVVGRKLRIYALAAVEQLFHLVLVEEASLPSSHHDLINTEHVYLTMVGFGKKVEITKRMLDNWNQQRVAARRERERTPEQRPK